MVDGGDPGTRLEILDTISLPLPFLPSLALKHFLYYYHTEHDFFDAHQFLMQILLLVGK